MTVYLVDTIGPVFTYVPDSLTVQCASGVPLASPDSVIVTDNCYGNLAIVISDSITNDSCPNQFILTRTWTATDSCGNYSTATRIITVIDTIPPVLYGIPADTGVCCPDSIPLPAYVTAIDSCDGEVAVSLEEIVSDSTGTHYFTLTRTWTATDTCSNITIASQVIEVNDTLYGGNSNVNIATPEDDKIIYFKVSPNPFTSTTNIQFSLAQDTYVSVEVYNYTGVKLKSIYNGNVTAGSDVSVRLSSVSSMQAGLYFLVLRTNQAIETRRIILQ